MGKFEGREGECFRPGSLFWKVKIYIRHLVDNCKINSIKNIIVVHDWFPIHLYQGFHEYSLTFVDKVLFL